MKLLVHVIEARGLRAMSLNGTSDPYARLQLGKHRLKTKVMKKTLNPSWDEEFSILVEDLCEEIVISILNEDRYFNDDFMGRVKVPLLKVMEADNMSLGTVWYQLQPRNKNSKNKERGDICLSISLLQKKSFSDEVSIISPNSSDDLASIFSQKDDLASMSDKSSKQKSEMPLSMFNSNIDISSLLGFEENETVKRDKSNATSFVDLLSQIFIRKASEDVASPASRDLDFSEQLQETSVKTEDCEDQTNDICPYNTFNELLNIVFSKDQGDEVPGNLPGGVLIDQSYVVAPGDLNSLLFSSSSNFWQSASELQGNTDLQAEPWKLDGPEKSLKRVISYTKAASKLVKAVKATEEQTYLKADGRTFAVLASVSTPDVPYGSYFKTEILYCIMPGPQLPSDDQSSHLLISWRMNFLQSTMMKGMIENGARQGLMESYDQFADFLSQNVEPVNSEAMGSNKERILASLQTKQESNWKVAFRLLGNFTVISSFVMGLYVLAHLLLASPASIHGLEFVGLDLPDSVGEIIVSAVLILQGQRALSIVGRFFQVWKHGGGDHGLKAQGDGWLLTVALIEGSSMAAVGSSGFSDPYVVFTCNGRTKTSSIKLQTANPEWNEIFEFDAMGDPPSRMDVSVYDFDGPFNEAILLGHAEVNFVKSNLSELSDVWIPLQGKLTQACHSKLHLRIFLSNTRGTAVVMEYLIKMEKEIGKKINLRSPQTNSAFQKLFGLPPEEFLINDFTCHLKRKMPLQGRLFLSPRIIGFYATIFGNKTKFFFLWEDIVDIQVIPPSLASVGSPSLMVILHEGRGTDAKHGAKAQDQNGRLKFHFQSFVSFKAANRTIMALWKTRSLSPEQKVQIIEEEYEVKTRHSEDSGSFLGMEDAKMLELFSAAVPLAASSLMEIFGGGPLEGKVMQRVGCVDYSMTPWESVKSDVYQRQISYKFGKELSPHGWEVTSTQQKSQLPDRNGWIIEEVMTLQGILLDDYFNLQLKYHVENLPSKSKECNVQVSVGIAWLKSTKHQKRIIKNIISSSSIRLKEMFSQVEEELLHGNYKDSNFEPNLPVNGETQAWRFIPIFVQYKKFRGYMQLEGIGFELQIFWLGLRNKMKAFESSKPSRDCQ